MKRYIYILLPLLCLLSLSCERDNIGPIFEKDVIFFDQESFDIDEDEVEDIVLKIGATPKGAVTSKITLGGTATEGVDYMVKGDLDLDFPEGVYIDNIVIALIDNSDSEGDLEIVASLPEGQGYSDNNRRILTITIVDDEVSSGTIVTPISDSADDVEEGETGAMSLDSSDLEFGEFDTSGTPDQGIQTIGLRFNDIAIPANATITEASIQFTADNIGADPVELTIFGEKTGNSAAFTVDDFNVTTRSKTTSNAIWTVPEWVTVGDELDAQKTVDLSAIVQEIVSGPDWSADNSLSFIMVHTGVSATVTKSDGGREAETFDGSAAPVLTIAYEL